ncbi:hypothetical protein [Oceanobacillus sojae]|uniref:hypothetical protein n=1 Tax=Oceanobacillus sojae TaxID=582851 RepID=UPI00363D5FFA
MEEQKKIVEKITVLYFDFELLDAPKLKLNEGARAIQEMIRKSEHGDSLFLEHRWLLAPLDVIQGINEKYLSIIRFRGDESEDRVVLQDN